MTTLNETHCHTHFEWGVILAGTALATAVSIVFIQFGSVIGLSSDVALSGIADLTHWSVLAIGLWVLATQLTASAVGGYMAGRLRSSSVELTPHENEVRDGLYGLAVWATSTVAVFIALSLGAAFAGMVEAQTEVVDLSVELADKEQNAAIIFAFILGATSCASAVIAWAFAAIGGDHRDSKKDFTKIVTFIKR